MKTFCVYALRVSDEELPFYIGKTFLGSTRSRNHVTPSELKKNTRKCNKIKSALADHKSTLTEVLDTFSDENEALQAEVYWIARYGRLDDNTGILCNHTDGGDGATNPRPVKRSEEHKQAISAANKGRYWKRSEAHLAALTAGISKDVSVYELDGTYIKHYKCILDACKELGTKSSSVSEHLSGKLKAVRGSNKQYQFRRGLNPEPVEPVKAKRLNYTPKA